MLVLRLLVMVLSIICLMKGHAEVSSSNTGMRSPATVRQSKTEVKILDRKKKKPKKPKKSKKTKKKKKPKQKPVTTTPRMTTSTISTTPTMKTTATTTTTAIPTTTASTISNTPTTTSTSTESTTISSTTAITSSPTTTSTSTESTTISSTTAITSSPTTIAATTADYGDCEATNGSPCIFPFKDGSTEYNECKSERARYYWCATSVYDSGKYKHWSYCPLDGSCPLPGGSCKTMDSKPCIFPFNDGGKEYNECADKDGKYFWCATSTTSSGKQNNWGKCPDDGTCSLEGKSTTTTSTTTASLPNNETAAAAIANVENALNKINDTIQDLETAGFSEDEKKLLETMNDLTDYLNTGSLTRNWGYDPYKINSWTQLLYTATEKIKGKNQVNPGFKRAFQTAENTCSIAANNAKLSKANTGPGRMFDLNTISEILAIITNVPSSSSCCAKCKSEAPDSEVFEHSSNQKQCDCYKTKPGVRLETMPSSVLDSGVCLKGDGEEKLTLVCPDGYSEKSNAPTFYLLKDWTYNKDVPDVYESANICATECKSNIKCDAVVSTICKGCQLLSETDSEEAPREEVNHYCLPGPSGKMFEIPNRNLTAQDASGKRKQLRGLLPNDIIICDGAGGQHSDYPIKDEEYLRLVSSNGVSQIWPHYLGDYQKINLPDGYVIWKKIDGNQFLKTYTGKWAFGSSLLWHDIDIFYQPNWEQSPDHQNGWWYRAFPFNKPNDFNLDSTIKVMALSDPVCKTAPYMCTEDCRCGGIPCKAGDTCIHGGKNNKFCVTGPVAPVCSQDPYMCTEECRCGSIPCKQGYTCVLGDENHDDYCVNEQLDVCDNGWLKENQGKKIETSSNRIINGEIVDNPKIWPWISSILVKKNLEGIKMDQTCTGVLVSCEYVMTAAHCVVNKKTGEQYPLPLLIVILGTVLQNRGKRFTAQHIYPENIEVMKVPNRDYDEDDQESHAFEYIPIHDIAIIKLHRPIYPKIDRYIRPILLPRKDYNYEQFFVAGFGMLGTKPSPTWIDLRQTTIFPEQPYICAVLPSGWPSELNFNPAWKMCFSQRPPTGAQCIGDSGSPGMITENNLWILQGILSMIKGRCDLDPSHALHMRVKFYVDHNYFGL